MHLKCRETILNSIDSRQRTEQESFWKVLKSPVLSAHEHRHGRGKPSTQIESPKRHYSSRQQMMLIYEVCVCACWIWVQHHYSHFCLLRTLLKSRWKKAELNKIMQHVWSSAHSKSMCWLVWIVLRVVCHLKDTKSQSTSKVRLKLCENQKQDKVRKFFSSFFLKIASKEKSKQFEDTFTAW